MEKEKAKKDNRGGKREGAGRKCVDGTPRVNVGFRLPALLLEELKREASRQEVSTTAIVEEALRHYLKGF